MDPIISLGETRLTVAPGERVATVVTVRNGSGIVERYAFDVVGAASEWTQVVPTDVSLMPNAEAQVQLIFQPPTAPVTPAGLVPFGVRCISLVDNNDMVVVEGEIEVRPALSLLPELRPVSGNGRFGSTRHLDLANWSNVPVQIVLVGDDPNEALRFKMVHSTRLETANRSRVRVRLKPNRVLFFGQPVHHNFSLHFSGHDATPSPQPNPDTDLAQVSGTYTQKPIVSAALIALIALVLILLIALSGLAIAKKAAKKVVPAVPQGLTALPNGPREVDLGWNPVKDASSYTVEYFRGDAGVPTASKEGVKVPTLVWTDQLISGKACFTVRAQGSGGLSAASDRVCATLKNALDGKPTPPTAVGEPNAIAVTFTDQLPPGYQRHLRFAFNAPDGTKSFVGEAAITDPNATGYLQAVSQGPGTYEVSLTWVQNGASTAPATVNVTVAAPPPTTVAGGNGGGGANNGGGGGGATTPPTQPSPLVLVDLTPVVPTDLAVPPLGNGSGFCDGVISDLQDGHGQSIHCRGGIGTPYTYVQDFQGKMSDGSAATPDNLKGAITWTSSDPTIATAMQDPTNGARTLIVFNGLGTVQLTGAYVQNGQAKTITITAVDASGISCGIACSRINNLPTRISG